MIRTLIPMGDYHGFQACCGLWRTVELLALRKLKRFGIFGFLPLNDILFFIVEFLFLQKPHIFR
jgi:hypothetical protein